MQFFKETNFPFVKYSKTAITISVVIIAIGIVSILFVRGLNFGIDFTGGTILQIRFDKPTRVEEIRNSLGSVQLQNSIIQRIAGTNEYLIRLPQLKEKPASGSLESGEGNGKIPDLLSQGLKQIKDNDFEVRRVDQVGPKIGKELRTAAILATIAALVVIGIYITIRFRFNFALGAVIALIHDVLFTLGLFSLFQLEISLSTIAAFLTIVGYSLNDTIVIYDRIRDNMKIMRLDKIEDIVNTSINESLSRTVVTSLTTFFVVLILSFAPGEIRVFAIAMMIGVVVGTYSSIYIAGPVVISLQKRVRAAR